MTRRRWIADEISGNQAALTGDHAAHLVRVLRARVGQEFDIGTGSQVRRGRVVNISNTRVEFELGAEVPASNPANITLLLAIFKFDRMEWAIEKCTELGVSQIVPVIARRTDIHLAAASAKRAERWKRIALQAAEQSRRPNPPEIAGAVKLKDALEDQSSLRIDLSEVEHNVGLSDLLDSRPDPEITLAVGPEGGWVPEELQQFQDAGWLSASLGSTILRAETAAIAAVAIASSKFGI